MFGSHDEEEKQADNTSVTSPTTDNAVSDGTPAADDTPVFDTSSISLPPSTGISSDSDTTDNSTDEDKTPENTSSPALPVNDTPSAPPAVRDDDQLLTRGDTDDLIRIKQDALHELSPLVGHLDQTPEEKFRTTMMMIQASDDQSMLQAAYDAAKSITDDKVRAQALLDVINEINYFTQQSK